MPVSDTMNTPSSAAAHGIVRLSPAISLSVYPYLRRARIQMSTPKAPRFMNAYVAR